MPRVGTLETKCRPGTAQVASEEAATTETSLCAISPLFRARAETSAGF